MTFPLCRDSRISQFYDYWNSLRVSDEIPGLAAFDPIEIAPLLSGVWKMHWEDAARDFVYRLAGEDILKLFAMPMRHKALGEIHDRDLSDTLRTRYQTVCRTPVAFYARGQVYRDLGRYGTGEGLVLPLTDTAGRPRIVIGYTTYTASLWPNPAGRGAPQDADVTLFTSLDGEPLERVRAAC